ncbi:proline-specific peptidase [Coprinopsis marcescibilis]|uniref:Proline-specific peptidase n=1 Tax=Coprinopsis marcescibilis TaxID=230819 RepID=A0A5C3L3U7_COPMA|nr:proline-specific peptidase [Coprinopsis marcescibilis]
MYLPVISLLLFFPLLGVSALVAQVTEGFVPFVIKGKKFQAYYKVHGPTDWSTNRAAPIPVVVLHGGPGFTHDYLAPFADLVHQSNGTSSSPRAVILYDQLGNGRSSNLRDMPLNFFSVKLYVNELSNLIKKLGLKEFHLVGHSWGGTLASEYAVETQDHRIKSVVLSNTLAETRLMLQSRDERISTLDNADEVREGFRLGFNDIPKYRAALLSLYGPYALRFVTGEIPKELDVVSTVLGDAETGEGGDSTGPLTNWSVISRLPSFKAPALLVTSPWDMLQPYVSEPFFWGVKKIKWISFEKSSHIPFWEQREEYINALGKWFEAIEEQRS